MSLQFNEFSFQTRHSEGFERLRFSPSVTKFSFQKSFETLLVYTFSELVFFPSLKAKHSFLEMSPCVQRSSSNCMSRKIEKNFFLFQAFFSCGLSAKNFAGKKKLFVCENVTEKVRFLWNKQSTQAISQRYFGYLLKHLVNLYFSTGTKKYMELFPHKIIKNSRPLWHVMPVTRRRKKGWNNVTLPHFTDKKPKNRARSWYVA